MSLHVWHLCANRWNSAITEYALSAARALQLGQPMQRSRFIALIDSPAARRARGYGLETTELSDFRIKGWQQLLHLLREGGAPDLVLCYGGAETTLVSLIPSLRQARLARFHGQALRPEALAKWRHRLAHRHVDVLLTPSEALATAVATLKPRQAVINVPLGLEAELFKPVVRSRELRRPQLLVFGRFDPVKGHRVLIERLAKLIQSWPAASLTPCLHIVGEPANVTATILRDWTVAAGLVPGEDVVVSTGRVADVPALLSRATLGVVPSLGSEWICRVAEEFLLCGTPVAVSGVGSLGEVVFSGAGFNYGQLTEEAANAAFCQWLAQSEAEDDDAKLRRSLQARRWFSLEAMANRLVGALR